ncbi:MAG: hypothetical protein ACXW4E_07435, partial [Anaerolineales bacterium]
DAMVRKLNAIPPINRTTMIVAMVGNRNTTARWRRVMVTANNTHFVVGKDFLLKEHKLAPAFWATSVDEDKIHSSVESSMFERIPDYQLD